MDDDQLPSVAILGAGPIGIEAALYARYLGYAVTVFEQEQICNSVLDWGHVTLFTPFELNCSSLGLSALAAQDNAPHSLRSGDSHTGQQWVDQYLMPLATSDLLDGCIRTFTTVTHISRDGQLPTDNVGQAARDDTQFRVLFDDENGEHAEYFDIVIDASGSYTGPNYFGSGGAPAIGELDLRDLLFEDAIDEDNIYTCWILYPELLDLCTTNRFVVIGDGYCAATNILQIAAACDQKQDIRCIWLTRGVDGPIAPVANDALPYRAELTQRANELARSAEWLDWRPGCLVAAVRYQEGQFELQLAESDEIITADHLISNVGYLGNFGMLEALQLHRCYASGAPMNWAVSMANTVGDCLAQTSSGTSAVITTEPDFYIIGAKSYGRDSRFLFQTGLQQIRDVFRVIGGRESLDVYDLTRKSLASNS